MKKILTFAVCCLYAATAYSAPEAELWDIWDADKSTNTSSIPHADWQTFLDTYVVPAQDGINRVDYAGVSQSEGRALLKRYIEASTAIDPRTYSKTEQFAYWINLYNAVTIDVVLNYPNKNSILRMGERFLAIGPWDDEVVTIAGEPVTLNDIEHRILRPIWQDHRIHFAVNCASIGCPNLGQTAYTADNIEALLDQAEMDYLNHPRGIEIVNDSKLQLSSIFKWYRSDFADSEETLLRDYVAKHRPDVNALLQAGNRIRVDYEYDWSLNRPEK
ncbi:MAG: DUF547 domain-containing protein [Pseudomonadota bacterium]